MKNLSALARIAWLDVVRMDRRRVKHIGWGSGIRTHEMAVSKLLSYHLAMPPVDSQNIWDR